MYNKALDAFKAVAEDGSFTKAAKRLFITHTAIQKQINQLEEGVGTQLFYRTHRGVTLTPAGKVLYSEAIQLIDFSEKAMAKVKWTAMTEQQTLTVGTSTLYPWTTLGKTWPYIQSQNNHLHLKPISFNDDNHYPTLLESSFDFVIAPCVKKSGSSLSFFPMFSNRCNFAIPYTHPLCNHPLLEWGDLHGQSVALPKPGVHPVYDYIRQQLNRVENVRIVFISPYYNFSTFRQCKEKNLILLSLDGWKDCYPEFKWVPMAEKCSIPVGIVYKTSKSERMAPVVNALKNWDKAAR